MITKTIVPDLLNGRKFELPDRSEVAVIVGLVNLNDTGPAVSIKYAQGLPSDMMLVKATPKQLWFCPRAELEVKKNSRQRIGHHEWGEVVNYGLPKGTFIAFCHPADTEDVVTKMQQHIALECHKIIGEHNRYRQSVVDWVKTIG